MIDSPFPTCQTPHQFPTMEVIRFHCPACSAALTVPPAAAGFRGPCPKCSIEIIGPDPSKGLPASLPQVETPANSTFDPFPGRPGGVSESQAPPRDPLPELIPPTDPFAGTLQAPSAEPVSEPDTPPELEVVTKENEPLPEPGLNERIEPFKDFAPSEPISQPVEAPAPAAPNPPKSSAGIIVFSCLLCTILAFAAGFTSGRRIPDPGSPIFLSKQADTEDKPEPIPVPVRTWIPDANTDDTGQLQTAGPEATLSAFLNADNWAARSAYVMFPESIRQRMEAHSKKSDDGPIETTEVSLFEITEQAHIFKVSTPKVPEGFPVAVSRDGNSWLIDWETFIEFHEDRFNRFAAGKEGEHGIFHLLIKPAEPEERDTLFDRFLLNPPMPGRQQSAYIRKVSVTLARLQGIFDRQAGQTEEVFNKLLEGKGPPMVLALSYNVNSEGKSYLQIEDVVAIGWGPGEP